jgi:hypothetical protein
MSKTPFALETFETRNAKIPKNGFVIEMLLFLIFRRKTQDWYFSGVGDADGRETPSERG